MLVLLRLLAIILVFFALAPTTALSISQDEVLVAGSNGTSSAFFRIDRTSGSMVPIPYSGPAITTIASMAFEPSGSVLLLSLIPTPPFGGSLIRLDPQSGSAVLVNNDPAQIFGPRSLVVSIARYFLLQNGACQGTTCGAGIYELDSATGEPIDVTYFCPDANPLCPSSTFQVGTGMIADPYRNLYASGLQGPPGSPVEDWSGAIWRFDPDTHAGTSISNGGMLRIPATIGYDHMNDSLVVSDISFLGLPIIVRVDASTGAQTLVASGPPLQAPVAVAIEPDGGILIADDVAGKTFRIAPGTSTPVEFPLAAGYSVAPTALAIFPERAVPTLPGLSAVASACGLVASGAFALWRNRARERWER